MNFITITKENLESEHICCAISNNKDCQVAAKKAWLAQRLDDGLVFLKGDVRGKCFIEYLPAEKAWAPVEAAGYLYIDCLWVSGQLAGKGYSSLLLDACVRDAREQGKRGLAVLSSQKKKLPYLSDPGFLQHKGFLPADSAEPYFSLLYLPLEEGGEKPRFRQSVKTPPAGEPGLALYYTHQCPFTAKYVPLVEEAAREAGVLFRAVRLESAEEAQNAPTPFPTYSLFRDGKFLTHEILSVPKFMKLIG